MIMNQKRNSSLLGAVDGCAIVTFYSRAIRIESNQHGVKEKEIVWARDKNRRRFCCFFLSECHFIKYVIGILKIKTM